MRFESKRGPKRKLNKNHFFLQFFTFVSCFASNFDFEFFLNFNLKLTLN